MGDSKAKTDSKPAWEDQMWDSYNFLMKCPDVSRLRKLLARHELFKMSLDIPGKWMQYLWLYNILTISGISDAGIMNNTIIVYKGQK